MILAPEPSLTEGLSRPKTRSGSSSSGTSFEGSLPAWLPRFWLWILLAVATTVLTGVVFLAVFNPFGHRTAAVKKPRPPVPVNKTGPGNSSPEKTAKLSNGQTPADAEPPIVVRAEGETDLPFARTS